MFWYDGEIIEGDRFPLKINDPGLLYGATVFTTVRVYQSLGHPLTNWDLHCDRLTHSLENLGWIFPNWQRIQEGATTLSSEFPVLRITIFPNGKEWITGRFLAKDLAERQQQGIIAWVAKDSLFRRSLANYKTGNYLGAWLAFKQAEKEGAREAILIDYDDNWLETSTGNLWGWKDGFWWTPSLNGEILPGIVRLQLLRWLKNQGTPAQENIWSEDFLGEIEAIAYTNSVVEIIPIHTITNYPVNLTLDPFHPALKQLQSYFHQF